MRIVQSTDGKNLGMTIEIDGLLPGDTLILNDYHFEIEKN